MKKTLYIVLLAALTFSACSAPSESITSDSSNEQTVQTVEIINDTPEAFENNMVGEYLLLDVRTQEEYNDGHIDGSLLIPVTELEARLVEIEQYKDTPVLVYCRSGNRSLVAAEILIDNGFTNVHNLLTGYNGWTIYKNN
ncbi:MAG: rhodanese-like domain-containing protein [Clostridia bacterium]|nr:rhodanese-like domain-containing protein [Clostridia bacterium]